MRFSDEIKVDGVTLNVKIDENVTSIYNSYKIRNTKSMKAVIGLLRKKYPQEELSINKLKEGEILKEWKTHNMLCEIKVLPIRTCHLDTNLGKKWYHKLGYATLSLFFINRDNIID